MNALGLYVSQGPAAGRFLFETTASLPKQRTKKARKSLAERAAAHGLPPEDVGPIDSERLLAFIWKAAGRPAVHAADWQRERPLMIWLDNYSVHKSERVQAELPELERAGITLCYLPSDSPELSRMEPHWKVTKYHELRQRSYANLGALQSAVEAALTRRRLVLRAAAQDSVN